MINNLETLEGLLYFAVRAPSGHNSQPWKFLIRENEIEIHPDFDRALPVVDPAHRELFISLGCAAENLCIAAAQYGYSARWTLQKSPKEQYFIKVSLDEFAPIGEHPLFEFIEKRQTNRSVYSGREVAETSIRQLLELPREEHIGVYFFPSGSPEFTRIRAYVLRGNRIQMTDKAFKKELLEWIRFNAKQVGKTMDGLTYRVMGSPPLPKSLGKWIVRSFLNPKTQNKSDEEKINSSSHFLMITTAGNTTKEWVAAGVYLERLLLKMTAMGIANAYLNPPCELPELAKELRDLLPINGALPTLILRLGYADPLPYSPRRTVGEVLIN